MFTKFLRSSFCKALPLVAVLILTGCREDSPIDNAPGPATGADFANVTIEINPTISFLSNGQLTYLNSAAGSAFPAAVTAISGTFTYTPGTDLLAGTLAITLPTLGQTLQLSLSAFTTQGGKVTSFTTTYNGQSYSSTVPYGKLLAAAGTQSGTGSGSSSGSGTGSTGGTGGTGGGSTTGTTIPTPVSANEALAPDIPTTMQGTYTLTFTYPQTGTPVTEGTKKTFVIGAKSLAFDNKTLTGPVHRNQNPYEWIFKDGDLEYAVSITNTNTLNEINLGKTGGTPWYGQYRDLGGSGSTGSGSGSATGFTQGNFAAGTTFTRTVKTVGRSPNVVVSQPGVPAYTVGNTVTFTINTSGEITFSNIAIPFGGDGGTAINYTVTPSAGNSDTCTVSKTASGAPSAVAMYFTRATPGSLTVPVQTITYTLE